MLPNKRKALKRSLATITALVLLAILLAGCGGGGGGESKTVVATYQGGQVTEAELNTFVGTHEFFMQDPMFPYYKMMPGFQENMIRQLIATRLINDEVDKDIRDKSAKQAKTDIKELENSIKSDANNKKEFDAFMNELGIKTADLQAYLEVQYNLQEYFANKFTEEEVKQEFDNVIAKDKNAFTTATVRHVLVALVDVEGNDLRTKEEALARAQEVYQKLKNGGDWVALAAEYSDDGGSSDNGGKYEDTNVNEWVAEFRDHAINQPLDEVGEPFETTHGYHVMVVEKRIMNDYETVKYEVRGQMNSNFFTKYIMEELDNLDLKITLPQEDTDLPADNEGVEDSDNTDTDTDTDTSK